MQALVKQLQLNVKDSAAFIDQLNEAGEAGRACVQQIFACNVFVVHASVTCIWRHACVLCLPADVALFIFGQSVVYTHTQHLVYEMLSICKKSNHVEYISFWHHLMCATQGCHSTKPLCSVKM